jgi:hypothetical protein
MSVNDGVSFAEAAIASISPSCDDKPFIFQFPAIKGRMFYSRFWCKRQNGDAVRRLGFQDRRRCDLMDDEAHLTAEFRRRSFGAASDDFGSRPQNAERKSIFRTAALPH